MAGGRQRDAYRPQRLHHRRHYQRRNLLARAQEADAASALAWQGASKQRRYDGVLMGAALDASPLFPASALTCAGGSKTATAAGATRMSIGVRARTSPSSVTSTGSTVAIETACA